MILTRKSARLVSRSSASRAPNRDVREPPLQSAWFLALAVACGGTPAKTITYYSCTPGTGTASVLGGRWAGAGSDPFTLELIGTADQLCGSGSLGPSTRRSQAGISGTQAPLRWGRHRQALGPQCSAPDPSDDE